MLDKSRDLDAAKSTFIALSKSSNIPNTGDNLTLFLAECEKQYLDVEKKVILWIEGMKEQQKRGRDDRLWQTVSYQAMINDLLSAQVKLVFDLRRAADLHRVMLLGRGLGGFLAAISYALASEDVFIRDFFGQKMVIRTAYPSIKTAFLKRNMRQMEMFRDQLQMSGNTVGLKPLQKRITQIAGKGGLTSDQKTVLEVIANIFGP